jgi:sterol desaturase/sphingolipid hydroxylase (fatty acid hydroxylase superfamily)
MKTSFFDALSYMGFFLGSLCFLGVIAFHFPEYLSNPQMRDAYKVEDLRVLMFVGIYVGFALGSIGVLLSEKKILGLITLGLISTAVGLGGPNVEVVTPIKQSDGYLSLDLIILDLLFMSILFVPIERLFYLRPQRILRQGLRTDLAHYAFNHLLMGALFILIAWPAQWLKWELFGGQIPEITAQLPLWIQILLILFCADFVQYWVHRAFHRFPVLWQFHKIHHSTETMDWLAGSRLHVVDVVITRGASYIPIICLGFSPEAIRAYLPVVAIQAVYVHSNTRFEWSRIKLFLTTPQIHHWHHSSDIEALDKNFAVAFSFIDRIFGTFYCPKNWPQRYGLYKEHISENFLKQLIYPFLKAVKRVA